MNSRKDQMRALLGERSGDARTNAATTLDVTAQAMAKTASVLKNASKEFAVATQGLRGALKAAHEMSDSELKALKKLLDNVDTVTDKLKKYTRYAEADSKDASKLCSELRKPGSRDRIPPEPDPDKPFRQPSSH